MLCITVTILPKISVNAFPSPNLEYVLSSRPHELPDVPNTKPLVPACTSRPPFTAKQAPINPTHKLRMPAHPPYFPALLTSYTF